MKQIMLLVLVAIVMASCTNRLIVQDVQDGELIEAYTNGMEEYIQIGDTILVQVGITELPSAHATGSYRIPEPTFGKYISSYSGDTVDYAVYYREVLVLDKVMR